MFHKITSILEKIFSRVLITAAFVYISFEVIELILKLYGAVVNYSFTESVVSVDYDPFKGFIVIFFNILIAVEMIETLRIDTHTHVERARLILLIGLIALVRKLLDLDLKHLNYQSILGIASLIAVLCLGYFLLNNKSNSTTDKLN